MSFIHNLLQNPLTKDLDLDDPQTTILRKQIIQEKPLLKEIYQSWYSVICKQLPHITGPVLEIGSGPGFLKEYIPELITSDYMALPGNDLSCDALQLPFTENSIRAIILINVLHHLQDPLLFFQEANRCLRNGGSIIMIEPWVTWWSQVVYRKLHHEPFDPDAPSWKLPPSGPLSGGNDALPWIIFHRDLEKFRQLESFQLKRIQPTTPILYLLSGGLSMRNLIPRWLTTPLFILENAIPTQILNKTAMFTTVVIDKNSNSDEY